VRNERLKEFVENNPEIFDNLEPIEGLTNPNAPLPQ
jgi:hypothetical protein